MMTNGVAPLQKAEQAVNRERQAIQGKPSRPQIPVLTRLADPQWPADHEPPVSQSKIASSENGACRATPVPFRSSIASCVEEPHTVS
jgi:hypothetical protein